MATFTYSTVPGKVGPLLKKVGEVGVPPKASVSWLKSIGYTSSNDPTLLGVLKQVGLIDGNSVPTQRWKDYRGKDGRKALADAIRTGYAELYSTYPDAEARSTGDLEAFFKTHSDAGQQTIDKTVSTFRALVKAADFSVPAGAAPGPADTSNPDLPATTIGSPGAAPGPAQMQPVTVNINVQLVLPESTDDEVYRKFFAAMRDHLLSPSK